MQDSSMNLFMSLFCRQPPCRRVMVFRDSYNVGLTEEDIKVDIGRLLAFIGNY